jgi:hypothetical protein
MSRGLDLVCLSHLRWGFVYQRPNHLMARAAREHRVFFVEEPVYGDSPAGFVTEVVAGGLTVCTPQLPAGTDADAALALQRSLLREFMRSRAIERPILWFYTPMAVPLTHGVEASLVVYDCMDELSGFAARRSELVARERALFARPTWCSPAAKPVRGQARAAPRGARLPEQRRRRALRARARDRPATEPADQRGHPAPPGRLLRRHRRAHRPRPDRRRSPTRGPTTRS